MNDSTASRVLTAGLVVVLLLAGAIAPATAHESHAETETESVFEVAVHEDGSATITVVYTFDLTTVNETQAFEQLRDDADARERFRTNFRQRMEAVASATENVTDREMSVGNATVEFSTSGQTGFAAMRVRWDGLAAVDGDRLVVTEPFASEFTPDRKFRLVAPDGYAIDSVTPTPDESGDGQATWEDGTSLDGFEAVLTPEPTATPTATATPTSTETTSGGGPGFGVVVAIGALLAAGALAARRRP